MKDWNWDVEVAPWAHSQVGEVTFGIGIEFRVKKWNTKEGSAEPFHIGYSVNYEVLGCSGQVLTKVSRKQAEAYLAEQMKLVPEYERIRAKRDAINARMKPLERKRHELYDRISSLIGP